MPDLLNIQGAVKVINSETLPEAAKLMNDATANIVGLLNGTLEGLELWANSAVDRAGGKLTSVLEPLITPLQQIVVGGLELKGTFGGMPVDLVLLVGKPKQ